MAEEKTAAKVELERRSGMGSPVETGASLSFILSSRVKMLDRLDGPAPVAAVGGMSRQQRGGSGQCAIELRGSPGPGRERRPVSSLEKGRSERMASGRALQKNPDHDEIAQYAAFLRKTGKPKLPSRSGGDSGRNGKGREKQPWIS